MALAISGTTTRALLRRLPSSATSLVPFTPRANFSLENKGKEEPPHPFDYVNKNYNYFRHFYLGNHYTMANMHDNSLFFQVESNFGIKSRAPFAKRLADHIGFLHIPKPDLDRMHFMDETGTVNTRQMHNDYCLKRDRFVIPEEWHDNPNHIWTIRMLRPLLECRTYQLRMGLSHIFSTGDGIVMDKSYWSFYGIVNVLRDFNLINADNYDFLFEYKVTLDHNLKMPHLIIFIDKDPDAIYEDLQQNGKDYLKNSKVYTREFLREVDRMYKEEWLPRMSTYCHVLQFTEEEIENMDDVVFDIEALNFDDTNKFPDWRVSVDLDIERFRERLQHEHFWKRMFNLNRLSNVSGWRQEPNAAAALLNVVKNDPRYKMQYSLWDPRPFFIGDHAWTRLPFY